MRPLLGLALLGLLTASLAGCADDPARYPDGVPTSSSTRSATEETGSDSGGTSSGTTTEAPGAGNEAPTGTIAVAINGTNATFTLSGSDPDGDPIVWDLDFGDGNATNGTSLPQLVNHTYTGGNYTANFTISDGQSFATFSAPVDVAGVVAGGGQQLVFTGTMVAPDPTAQTHVFCLQAAILEHEGADAPGGDAYPLPAETWGGTWVLVGDGIKAQFVDYENTVLLAEGQAGEVPEGTTWVHICSETAANTPYTLTIDH